MSEKTKIEWADHTSSPWLICSKVSAGCANCYAWALLLARLASRIRAAFKLAGFADWETMPLWGDKAPRVLTKGFWKDAVRFNRDAMMAGKRMHMFPSMMDWLDTHPAGMIDQMGNRLDPIMILARFLRLVHATPWLTWILLTKRPENFAPLMQAVISYLDVIDADQDAEFMVWLTDWVKGKPPAHVWILVSVEDQPSADKRVPRVQKIPAAVRGFSVEPMLGPIEFDRFLWRLPEPICADCPKDIDCECGFKTAAENGHPPIHLMIFGGESGTGARHCNINWIRSGVKDCRAANVKAYVKQLGSRPILPFYRKDDEDMQYVDNTRHEIWQGPKLQYKWHEPDGQPGLDAHCLFKLKNEKGGDMSEWPEDLRGIREFPE